MRVLLSPGFLCDQKEGRLTMQYCPLGRSLMAAEGETFKITRKRSARSLTLVLTGDSRASKLRGGNFISQITSFLHYQHDIEQSETESCSCCCCSKQSSVEGKNMLYQFFFNSWQLQFQPQIASRLPLRALSKKAFASYLPLKLQGLFAMF